ncbi:MAG: HAMP domain-containing sensor histidine kinase [Clostridia bacterium]
MIKNKIALKLSLYFAVALLVFSLIISGVFLVLFRNNTIELHKAEMEKRAVSIATTLSTFMAGQGATSDNKVYSGMRGGYGAYMRFIGDIAGSDVWIVDKDLNLITSGMGDKATGNGYKYGDLPKNATSIVKEVLNGKTVFSEDFSSILTKLTLTVGTPIKTANNEVLGVVLLHSPVEVTNQAIFQGFTLLVLSMVAALLISFLLAIRFSITFTKPLNNMKTTALRLVNSDYTAKNNIKQNDEIGELSLTLDVLAERLELANIQGKKLEQLRKDFVANISHELKTPITVIRGSLEALLEKVVTNPITIESYHQQMLSEILFLQRLVGDLLDLSRLQNLDFIIEKEKISFCAVLDDAIRSASQIAIKKAINISVNKDGKNCLIDGDYNRLRQMLIIVLDNAIKFSPEGSSVELVLQNATLTIRDHGAGIAKEDLPYIFDRFYRTPTEQNKSGTGLGLAIAEQIAARHNIEIVAENAIGGGAIFSFRVLQS